jgi:threonine/homoserine/homoserine lactone efflux protein
MSLTQLLLLYGTFMLISLSGALSPGPLTALAIGEGARAGRWAGVRLAAGHGLVEGVLVFALAYGLGVWLQQPLVSGIIGVVGAGVLLWMGYGLLMGAGRGRLTLAEARDGPAPGVVRWGHVPGGALITVANPYWVLWWATLGAVYVARVAALQLGLLSVAGLVFTHWLTDLLWLGSLSFVIASGRQLIGERGYRIILLVCGAFLAVFGLYFAWSGIRFLVAP